MNIDIDTLKQEILRSCLLNHEDLTELSRYMPSSSGRNRYSNTMSNIANVRDAINRTTDLAGLRSVLQQAVRYYRGINLANERGRALLIRMIACFEISLLTVDLYINLAQRQRRQQQRGTGRKSHRRRRNSKKH